MKRTMLVVLTGQGLAVVRDLGQGGQAGVAATPTQSPAARGPLRTAQTDGKVLG